MNARSLSSLGVLGCAVLLFVAGCFTAAPPENEVTWAVKAATGNLTNATTTEWQAVATQVDEALPETDVALTDAQAQAIVDFVQENEINDMQDIQDMIEQGQNDPNSIVIPDSFAELFTGFSGDDAEDFLSLLEE